MPSSRLIRRLTFLIVCLFASPALADSGYLEYSAGVAFVRNQNLTGSDASDAGFSGRIESQTGYTVGAAVGGRLFKILGADFRTELALNYRHNQTDGMAVQGSGISPRQASEAKGNLSLFTAMINHYLDYDLDVGVIPYVGVGYGYGLVIASIQNQGNALKINDQASVFAWNVMAGITIPYTETVDFTGGYRYVSTTDFQLDSRILSLGPRRFDSEYDAHEITAGIRIKF